MNPRPFIVAALASAWLIGSSGCISTVRVRKAEPGSSTPGVRYSLPAVFLVGKPAADGTIEFTTEYLPDEANTYAVSTMSFMSKQKLETTVTDGLLTKIDSVQNSAEVAKAMAESLGDIEEKKRQRKLSEETQAAAKIEAALTAVQAKVDAAQTARDSAAAAVAAADDKLAKTEKALELKPGDVAAQIAVEDAKIDRDRARTNLAAAEQRLAEAKNNQVTVATGGKISGANDPKSKKNPQAWGPVVYRVRNSVDANGNPRLGLEAVAFPGGSKQIQVAASKKLAAATAPAKAPVPDLTLDQGSVIRLPSNGAHGRLTLSSPNAFQELRYAFLRKPDGTDLDGPPPPMWISASRRGRHEVVVSFDPQTPVGRYQLAIAVEYGFDPQKPEPKQATYDITVAK